MTLDGADLHIAASLPTRPRPGLTGRPWLCVSDDWPFGGVDRPAALFHYLRDRRGEHPRVHLGTWSGNRAARNLSVQSEGIWRLRWSVQFAVGAAKSVALCAHAGQKGHDNFLRYQILAFGNDRVTPWLQIECPVRDLSVSSHGGIGNTIPAAATSNRPPAAASKAQVRE